MLPTAALNVVDQLITAVMTLVRAVAPGGAATPTLPESAAQTLFFRLTLLATHLIRISNFGVRTPTKPKPPPEAPDHLVPEAPPSRPARPRFATFLPRRPGWLLAALPEIAPPIAADVSALLADPAVATLLDRAPSLHRILRPLLRSLGLTLDSAPTPPRPASSPPPTATPPNATPPNAAPPNPAPPRLSNPLLPTPISKLAVSAA